MKVRGRPRKQRFDFSLCKTAEEFADALQTMLATGQMSEADQRGAQLLAKVKGWVPTASERREQKAARPPRVTETPVIAARTEGEKNAADGHWWWLDIKPREPGEDYFQWKKSHPIKHGPFTGEQMILELLTLEPLDHPAISDSATGTNIDGVVWVQTPLGHYEIVPCAHDKTHSLETLNHVNNLWTKRDGRYV